jgi:hypothetical protein
VQENDDNVIERDDHQLNKSDVRVQVIDDSVVDGSRGVATDI